MFVGSQLCAHTHTDCVTFKANGTENVLKISCYICTGVFDRSPTL